MELFLAHRGTNAPFFNVTSAHAYSNLQTADEGIGMVTTFGFKVICFYNSEVVVFDQKYIF